MKAIIVYCSRTGFTQRYAQWLAQEIGAETLALGGACAQTLADYDTVVYGGSIHAGIIGGLRKIKALLGGASLAGVFAVGATPADTDAARSVWQANFSDEELEKLPHCYFPGGLNYEKMSFGSRLLMKIFGFMMKHTKNMNEEQEGAARALGSSYDISSREYVLPFARLLREKEEKQGL